MYPFSGNANISKSAEELTIYPNSANALLFTQNGNIAKMHK